MRLWLPPTLLAISRGATRILAAASLAVVATLIVVPALADKPETALDKTISTTVSAIPIDFDREHPERKEFGKLIFRGGLNLFAKSIYFGGYSALALDPTGTKLLAISDAGSWMKADLDYNGRELKGLGNVTLGPLLGQNGKPLLADQERDSEGMALASGTPEAGTAFISFERKHRIARYPFTADQFGPPSGTIPLPPGAKRMEANRGIEALAMITAGRLKGTLVAFPERLPDKNGNLTGWLIGGPSPGTIALKPIEGFDITDAAALPDGGIVILERRFRYSEGIKMRIRRVSPAELKPGAVITGEVLLEATDSLNIDNMEAIAVHRRASGETVLTLMSDDNFSPLQRTLIMQFTLPDATAAAASAPAANEDRTPEHRAAATTSPSEAVHGKLERCGGGTGICEPSHTDFGAGEVGPAREGKYGETAGASGRPKPRRRGASRSGA
ncbi:esterase-like activity of phytase family protein [Methyloceanibacter sp.]|uniref:esterase-like activity of phytase family protein n=1 Tax=Methyloceanibacter sp. TaxID=1965321 RepID=UPI002D62D7B1|nr:esterase-like activity of phytase family protein [Methyloceanibacter sp.]HZP09092.1 esterase-like activity of phytase family protein [Methyloceanibacter sp.]